MAKDSKPLGYRRVSELLTELENTGLVISQTSSHRRHGYGTQYKLVVSPEMVGKAVSSEWRAGLVKQKIAHEGTTELSDAFATKSPLSHNLKKMAQKSWDQYVGLE